MRLFRDDFQGSAMSTTVTSDAGEYLFTDLEPGSYCLEFEIPEDFTVSPAHAGDDETVDSDGETEVNATTYRTSCFELAAGDVDLTRDLGVYEETDPTGEAPGEQPENRSQRMYLPSLQRSPQAGSAGASAAANVAPAEDEAAEAEGTVDEAAADDEPQAVAINTVTNEVGATEANERIYLPSVTNKN